MATAQQVLSNVMPAFLVVITVNLVFTVLRRMVSRLDV